MSRLVFGRDRIPKPWEPQTRRPCGDGDHLMDDFLARCVECGWLDPAIERCATADCDFPGDYEAEVEDKEGGQIVATAVFCRRHLVLGGIGLVPTDGPPA